MSYNENNLSMLEVTVITKIFSNNTFNGGTFWSYRVIHWPLAANMRCYNMVLPSRVVEYLLNCEDAVSVGAQFSGYFNM